MNDKTKGVLVGGLIILGIGATLNLIARIGLEAYSVRQMLVGGITCLVAGVLCLIDWVDTKAKG